MNAVWGNLKPVKFYVICYKHFTRLYLGQALWSLSNQQPQKALTQPFKCLSLIFKRKGWPFAKYLACSGQSSTARGWAFVSFVTNVCTFSAPAPPASLISPFSSPFYGIHLRRAGQMPASEVLRHLQKPWTSTKGCLSIAKAPCSCLLWQRQALRACWAGAESGASQPL